MWTKKELTKRGKLSHELLGLSGAAAVISVFFYGFLSVTAQSLVQRYCEEQDIFLNEATEWLFDSWIRNISFGATTVLFVVLFLTLVGTKIAYLKSIIQGIESLRMHRMDYEIPLEGNNEFTELAESINFLSKTERELQLKEYRMREEKELFIRTLSHDIRTPLTAILSYSEYMKTKENVSPRELSDYVTLMSQKAEQIKFLTDQLLDGSSRTLEMIDHGKFLMEQLADEWLTSLENDFSCIIDLDSCPDFSGEFHIPELRRIFDNLASNVAKYADTEKEVFLKICKNENRLLIEQKNTRKENATQAESYKIGMESIRKIAEQHGGHVETELTETNFSIRIILMEIK